MWRKNDIVGFILVSILAVAVLTGAVYADSERHHRKHRRNHDDRSLANAVAQIERGREIFRYDTFGNQVFWGDTLRLHEALAGEDHGGVGPGVSPAVALHLGLKVDVEALPRRLRRQLKRGHINLDDPAVTLALLKLDAVVGVTGFFDAYGQIESVGLQCALCHSQVDDTLAPGIGRRLDGWANRDLDVGRIIAAAPDLTPFAQLLGVDEGTVRQVLHTWGPGKFDAALFLDGKAFQPDGRSAATLIPPAFGLAGVNLHTSTGWGSVAHWNALVAVLEMGGQGRLYDPRLRDASKFPIAAANGFDDVRIAPDQDQVTAKLPALHLYQLSLNSPKPPRRSFDRRAAAAGEALFVGKARCSSCHVPPLFTEPGWNLHKPEEIGIDGFQAGRSPDEGYRTTPLKGLWTHTKGGFFHDGRFAHLDEVIVHYNTFFGLGLNEAERYQLGQYLKSL